MFKLIRRKLRFVRKANHYKQWFENGIAKHQMTEYRLKPVYNPQKQAYEIHLITDTVIKIDPDQLKYLKDNNFISLM